MILRTLPVALATAGLLAPSAGALLKQYHLNEIIIVESTNVSPNPDLSVQFGHVTDLTYAAIDDDGGGNPKLKKLTQVTDRTLTVEVPALGGRIFVSNYIEEGPTGEFTGTGSTDATIAWGILTGWTITGTRWCNSSPALICQINQLYQESSNPEIFSSFYDLGTWTFHSTGFVGTPYVYRTYQPGAGNDQRWPRGFLVQDGRIPALPLLAVACLGGSLMAGGLVELRRRGD